MGVIADAIVSQVTQLPGVTTAPHRFGGIEFRYGRFELGHLHGDRQADVLLTKALRGEVIEAGLAGPHHVLPDTGWVTRYLSGPEDVPAVVELFGMAHERLAARDRGRAAV